MSKQLKSLYLAVLGLFSVLACSFYSLSASAVDLTHAVTYQGSGASPQWHDDSTSSASNTWHTGSSTYSGNSGNASEFNSFYVRGNNGSNIAIHDSWFLQVSGHITFSGTDNKWNTSGNFSYTSVGNCSIVDFDFIDVQSHTGSTSNTNQIYNFSLICKYTGSNSGVPRINLRVHGTSQLDTYKFSVDNWFIWSPASGFDDSDIISAINNVRTSVNNLYNAVGTTNNKLNDTNLKLDDLNEIAETLRDSQEQANQDANDRYQDEKDTIDDNANQGKEDSESLGVIDLSILNPFTPWKYSHFSNGCSVEIPRIAAWLHSTQTTYTSWWCSNSTLTTIRTYLTNILNIASVMLVFGFAFKWLRTNNGED